MDPQLPFQGRFPATLAAGEDVTLLITGAREAFTQ